MSNHSLVLPALLSELIDSGLWPVSEHRQEFNPILEEEAAQKLSSEDSRIVLMPTPFHTVADEVRRGNDFWTRRVSNPNEIEYDKALIFADFGMGSDSPIILYYQNSTAPCVMYLKWIGNGENIRHQWLETHQTFEEFAKAVDLVSRLNRV